MKNDHRLEFYESGIGLPQGVADKCIKKDAAEQQPLAEWYSLYAPRVLNKDSPHPSLVDTYSVFFSFTCWK